MAYVIWAESSYDIVKDSNEICIHYNMKALNVHIITNTNHIITNTMAYVIWAESLEMIVYYSVLFMIKIGKKICSIFYKMNDQNWPQNFQNMMQKHHKYLIHRLKFE